MRVFHLDRSARKKIKRETRKLTDVMTQMDLIDVYRIVHPNTKEYTFFSVTHGTSLKTDHTLSHKAYLDRYKVIGINPLYLIGPPLAKVGVLDNNTHSRKPTNSGTLKTVN